MKLLLKNGPRCERENKLYSALYQAVLAGQSKDYNIIDMLLDHKVCIDKPWIYGFTALHLAIKGKKRKIVDFLQAGATNEIGDSEGNCLILAAQSGDQIYVRLFCKEKIKRTTPSEMEKLFCTKNITLKIIPAFR